MEFLLPIHVRAFLKCTLVLVVVHAQVPLPYEPKPFQVGLGVAEPWIADGGQKQALPSDKVTDCGEVRTLRVGDYGVIESPGYPFRYSAGLDCEWRVEGPPDSVIQATLFYARIQSSFLSKFSDSLYLSLNGNWSNLQRYSGDLNSISPLVLLSAGNQLGVRFTSSKLSKGDPGFKLAYNVRGGGGGGGKPIAGANTGAGGANICNPTTTGGTGGTGIPGLPNPSTGTGNTGGIGGLPSTGNVGVGGAAAAALKSNNPDRSNAFPFLAALILDDKQFCSGTLVGRRHVLTSAHCLRGVEKFDIILGTTDLSVMDADVQTYRAVASDATPHPNFNPSTGANDIGVITLSENVTFTSFVHPAKMLRWDDISLTLSEFRVGMIGWGDTEKGVVYSTAEQQTSTILPNSFCGGQNRESSGLTMCTASATRTTNTNTHTRSCQGDAGSPIFIWREDALAVADTDPESEAEPRLEYLVRKKVDLEEQPAPTTKPKPKPKPKPNPCKPVMVGLLSHGSCERGFAATRITAALDFLDRFAFVTQ